jgi:hypothetical protein
VLPSACVKGALRARGNIPEPLRTRLSSPPNSHRCGEGSDSGCTLAVVPQQESVSAILKTTDVAGTIDWYRRVGFEIRGVYPDRGEPTWCEVSRDGVILQFLGGETPWSGPPTFTGTFYFHPESVEGLYEQIKDHTPPAWGPEVRDWGARELGLQDPNGYFLTFTEPALPRAKRESAE